MRALKLLQFALVALLAASCLRNGPLDPVVTVQLESPFTLRAGQEAIIEGSPFRLRFVGVVQDSRCGIDVMCIWAGDAQLHLVVDQDAAGEERLDLHTTLEPRSAIVHGYRVALEDLEPAPRGGRTIAPDQYRAEFRVTREP